MNKVIRMLMMFGPMLYRAYQKYQRGNSKQQASQSSDDQLNRDQQADTQQFDDRGEHG